MFLSITLVSWVYMKEHGADFASWGVTAEQLLPITSLLRFLFLVGCFGGLAKLVLPSINLIGEFDLKSTKDLSEDLEKARQYSAEFFKKLISAISVDSFLYSVACADKKHIKNHEEKSRYRTTAVIIILIGSYTFFSVYYLLSIGGGRGYMFDVNGFLESVSVFNGSRYLGGIVLFLVSVVANWSIVVAIVFSLFVVSIDRLIIADHSTEYRLFKIRLQKLEIDSYEKSDQRGVDENRSCDVKENSDEKFSGPRERRRGDEGWWKWYTWGLWTRSSAVSLRKAPVNFREWQRDAAALFHPRVWVSLFLTLSLRGLFAYATSTLVSMSILMIVYSNDIDKAVYDNVSGYRVDKLTCKKKGDVGCQISDLNSDVYAIKAKIEMVEQTMSDETNAAQVTRCYFVFKKNDGGGLLKVHGVNSGECNSIKVPDGYSVFAHDQEVSTGSRSSLKSDLNPRQSEFGKKLSRYKDDLSVVENNIKEKEKEIDGEVSKYRNSISIRLDALESVSKNGGSFEVLKRALVFLLIGFELMPFVWTKFIPLFGWTPGSYLLNVCRERIEEEKRIFHNLLSNEWPCQSYDWAHSKYTPPEKDPSEMDYGELLVGVLYALRMPILWIGGVVVAAYVFVFLLTNFLDSPSNGVENILKSFL